MLTRRLAAVGILAVMLVAAAVIPNASVTRTAAAGLNEIVYISPDTLTVSPEADTMLVAGSLLAFSDNLPALREVVVRDGNGLELARRTFSGIRAADVRSVAPTPEAFNQLATVRTALRFGQANRYAPEVAARASENWSRLTELAAPGTFTVEVPLASFGPKAPGDKLTLTVTTLFGDGASTQSSDVTVQGDVAALPARAGWVGGDSHAHADDFYPLYEWKHTISLAELKTTARSRGYHYIYLGEHADIISEYVRGAQSGFSGYSAELRTQSLSNLPLLPGEEMQVSTASGCDGVT